MTENIPYIDEYHDDMEYPLPGYAAIIMKQTDVRAGDVLLGYAAITADEEQAKPLGYSHAAIALSNQLVLEASTSGVSIIKINDLLDEYEHLAVLRNRDHWDSERLKGLENFAQKQKGKPFNLHGMQRVPDRKEKHGAEMLKQLQGYFDGSYTPPSPIQSSYFCSQLVACAFIDANLIGESGSIVFSPKVMSPSDIGIDKLFGFFVGYVPRSENYEVPMDDYFRHFL